VTTTEARKENLRVLRGRYPTADVQHLDLERPTQLEGAPFEIVYCYGTLYHLRDPELAIEYLSANCAELLLLETCVSFGDELAVNLVDEDRRNVSQAISGGGCRPTRPWVLQELKQRFEFVYVPVTQPNHEEFPNDWTRPDQYPTALTRAVFVGSRKPIENSLLTTELPAEQDRHP
jgi:hypothetical protein